MTPEPLNPKRSAGHEPCFACNKPLRQAVTGRDVVGRVRMWGGRPVWLHKHCAEQFDREEESRCFEED